MSSPRLLSEGVSSPSLSLADFVAFNERVSELNTQLRLSRHVFAAPLGPYLRAGRPHHVPRYHYFGTEGSPVSLRLAFQAGFDSRDLRATLSLLSFVQNLARNPGLASGINLTFFPLVNVGGIRGTSFRSLNSGSWTEPSSPEIALLAQDARSAGYHGFIRLETTSAESDTINVTLRGQSSGHHDAELISTEGLEAWDIRWKADPGPVSDGPLTLSDDLASHPYELVVSLPAVWELARQEEAAVAILNSLIHRYQTLQAYGQHL